MFVIGLQILPIGKERILVPGPAPPFLPAPKAASRPSRQKQIPSSRFAANQDLLLRVLGLSQGDQG